MNIISILLDIWTSPDSKDNFSFRFTFRGLVGYRSVFSSDTRGTGFMHRAFLSMFISLFPFSFVFFFPFQFPLSLHGHAIGMGSQFSSNQPWLTWIKLHFLCMKHSSRLSWAMFSEPDRVLNRKSYRFTVHWSDQWSNRWSNRGRTGGRTAVKPVVEPQSNRW